MDKKESSSKTSSEIKLLKMFCKALDEPLGEISKQSFWCLHVLYRLKENLELNLMLFEPKINTNAE